MFIVLVGLMAIPFSSAYASWHWSSDYEVCGLEIVGKGEKCNLKSEDKKDTKTQPVKKTEQEADETKKICKSGLVLIIKKTTNSFSCVKDSSFEKLIQRGWGITS